MMDYIFLDFDDDRYKNSGKYFAQEGFNDDNKCGNILGEFDTYPESVTYAKNFGIVVEDMIENRSILPEI